MYHFLESLKLRLHQSGNNSVTLNYDEFHKLVDGLIDDKDELLRDNKILNDANDTLGITFSGFKDEIEKCNKEIKDLKAKIKELSNE